MPAEQMPHTFDSQDANNCTWQLLLILPKEEKFYPDLVCQWKQEKERRPVPSFWCSSLEYIWGIVSRFLLVTPQAAGESRKGSFEPPHFCGEGFSMRRCWGWMTNTISSETLSLCLHWALIGMFQEGKLEREIRQSSNVCNSKEGKHIKTNWNLFSRSRNGLGDWKMFRWMVGGGMEKFEYHSVVIGFCFGRNGELTNFLKIKNTEFYFKKQHTKPQLGWQ